MGQWYRVTEAFSSQLQRFPLGYEFDEDTVYRVNPYPTTDDLVALGLLEAIASPPAPELPPETFAASVLSTGDDVAQPDPAVSATATCETE